MTRRLLTIVLMAALAQITLAQANEGGGFDSKPLPTVDQVLQRVVARAVGMEDRNDELFNRHYEYTRTRTWEYRNSHGDVIHREEKRSLENKSVARASNAKTQADPDNEPAQPPAVSNSEPRSETHSNIRGKAFKTKVKDYSIPNLVKRFKFTLVGREMLNGRPSLVVDFKPLSDDLPVNQFADKFINKAAGRAWIDEEDYAIAQAKLYLTKQVNVFGGLVGAVWKFTYQFTRLRTPEGYWFARSMDWHLEGREVIFNRIVDYHERKLDQHRLAGTTASR